MNEYKLFTLRTGLVGITNLLLGLSDIILLPILTKNLPIEDYGIWVMVIVTITLLPTVVTLGLPYSMVRFLAVAKNKEEIQEGFYSILFIDFILVTMASSFFFLFSKPIAASLFDNEFMVVRIMVPILFIHSLNDVLSNFFRTFQQIKKHSAFLLLRTTLRIVLVTYFVLSGKGIIGAVIGLLICKLIVFLIMFSLIILKIGLKIPKFSNLKEYLGFGIPTIPGGFSSWIVRSSDRYIIGMLLGMAFVGYYSPGYAVGNRFITLLMAPLSFILPASLSKYYDENRIKEVKTILRYSLKYFLALAIPSVFGLSLLSKPILRTLSTLEIALEGYLIIPFVAITALFFGVYSVMVQIIILKKKTKIIGVIWSMAAILNFGLNMILIPYVGILGAAIATLIANALVLILTVHYSVKYVMLDFDFGFILKSIIASIMMSLVIILWYPINILDIFVVIGICIIIYAGILLLLRGFKKEEIKFFKELLKFRQ